MRTNPWQSYREVATQTAPPGHLVLMLYDGAIRFLDVALTGFGYDDPLEFNRTINDNVLRAQAIINELNVSLNMDEGGEFSSRLRSLYNYFDRQLQESNLRKEKAGIQDVMKRLTILRDAWSDMLRQGQHSPTIASSSTSASLSHSPA